MNFFAKIVICHIALSGVPLVNEGNEILLVLSSQREVCLFWMNVGAKECQKLLEERAPY